MPYAPPRPCSHPGCSALTNARYCLVHAPHHAHLDAQRERQRGVARRAATPHRYGGDWPRIRATHLTRYPLCQQCKRPADVVDHIFPLRFGGTHHSTNLQSLCHSCHNQKSRREQLAVEKRTTVDR